MLTTLTNLSSKSKTYIPLYTQILSILTSSLLTNPKPSTQKQITIETIIKFPKEYVGTIVCAKQVFEKCMQVIYSQMEMNLFDSGFPGNLSLFINDFF